MRHLFREAKGIDESSDDELFRRADEPLSPSSLGDGARQEDADQSAPDNSSQDSHSQSPPGRRGGTQLTVRRRDKSARKVHDEHSEADSKWSEGSLRRIDEPTLSSQGDGIRQGDSESSAADESSNDDLVDSSSSGRRGRPQPAERGRNKRARTELDEIQEADTSRPRRSKRLKRKAELSKKSDDSDERLESGQLVETSGQDSPTRKTIEKKVMESRKVTKTADTIITVRTITLQTTETRRTSSSLEEDLFEDSLW